MTSDDRLMDRVRAAREELRSAEEDLLRAQGWRVDTRHGLYRHSERYGNIAIPRAVAVKASMNELEA